MAKEWDRYPPYVSVATRKARNARAAKKLGGKRGRNSPAVRPIAVEGRGRKLARSFWGAGWITHLATFSDYEKRLPRGRSYLRNGAVLDLQIAQGVVTATVNGSRLYQVTIEIRPLPAERWREICKQCSGQIGSLLALLAGELSDEVMTIVTDRKRGLLPRPGEIELGCTCPDWAVMCKHVAATLFGIGVRLDEEPEVLFELRGVDPADLIAADLVLPAGDAGDETGLDNDDLGAIFGVDLDQGSGDHLSQPAFASLVLVRPRNKATAFRTAGSFIAHLRADFGLSVRVFAEMLEVSVPTVYRWEKSRRKLRVHEKNLALLRRLNDRRNEQVVPS